MLGRLDAVMFDLDGTSIDSGTIDRGAVMTAAAQPGRISRCRAVVRRPGATLADALSFTNRALSRRADGCRRAYEDGHVWPGCQRVVG
jgi:beta-phosphoglucomutase-like phosphatase (HAD superfamily)